MKNTKRGKSRERLPVPHKTFWVGLISFFIISIMFILSYIANPTLTGNAAVQTISFMKAGNELHFEVRNINGVKDVTITILEDVKNGVISFDETKPAFQGIVYSAFKVSSADDTKFGKLVFTLKLSETELKRLGLDSDEVMLYHDGNELVIEQKEKVNGYISYSVTSQGFGEYVIGKAAAPEVVKEPEEEIVPEEKEVPEERMPAPVEEVVKKSWWQRLVEFLKNLV